MATQVIETPGGIPFAGFYYPEIFRDLLSFLRQNKERIGLTDENDFEVHVQLLKAFGLVGHLNNTRLDVAATELLIDSASLLESVKKLLRLVGIELRSAAPAVADIVATLSEVTTVDQTDFIPEIAEFATDAVPPITYEALTAQDLNQTDEVDHVFGLEEVDSFADSSHTLSMVSSSSDVVQRSAGSWPTDVVGHHLFINVSISLISTHIDEFRVTQRLNATDIKVVRVPGSTPPGFQNDSGINDWSLKKFTSDEALAANTTSSFFSPWTDVEAGDLLFVGHTQVLHTQVDITHNTVGAGITGVWEYPDNELSRVNPKTVVDLGSTLEFDLETLLGTADRRDAIVTVTFLQTGASEKVKSIFTASKNKVVTSGLLGQVVASVDPTDYHITADWIPFENQDDNTISGGSSFAQDGEASWDLPETRVRQWLATEVNLLTGYWARFRVVSVSTPTSPSLDRIFIDQGDQHVKTRVTQGETIGPQIIGSSDGQASQEFELPEIPYFDDTESIEIDEGGGGSFIEYTRVLSFLRSFSTDRHYTRETDATGKATIIFGDSVNGRIPPAGVDNIRATYRIGGEDNGNVGANQIVTNAEGLAGVSDVFNPRPAGGWRIQDGGDEQDLKRVKRESPAELRTRGTASTADDVARLAVTDFVDSAGTKPVARAFAVEEGFGVKTIKLIVVGSGGTVLTQQQLDDLSIFFNGNSTAVPPTSGVLVANQRAIPVNFEPKLVNIVATVTWPGGSAERIRNTLLAFLTPLAKEDDEATFIWDFGSQVSFSRVHSLIHEVDPSVIDVATLTINGFASSLTLGGNELPITTANNLTISVQV